MPIVIPAAPSSSSSAQSVPTQNVFDYLLDSQGKAQKGKQVVITLNVEAANSITPQVTLNNLVIVLTTDSNGFWSANLIPNANINPANTTYSIQIHGIPAYEINIPSAGGPFQSTSPSVLVNTPAPLQPATTGITGNLTISGNETVTGTLSVAGTTTLAGTTTGALTTAAIGAGGDVTIANTFRLLFSTAVAKIIGGATSLSLRDNADANDNLLVANNGDVTVRARLLIAAAVSKLVPGATSFSIRDNADANDNFIVTNAGVGTLRGLLTTQSTPYHAEAYRNAALSIANTGAFVAIPYDTLDSSGDPNSNFNTGTGVYTCPVAGLYRVAAVANFNVAASGTVGLTISKNAGTDSRRLGTSQATTNPSTSGSAKIRCNASDTLAVQVSQNTATNPAALFTGASLLWAQFEYVGP